MSNLAIGMAIGSTMNSGTCTDVTLAPWVALFLVVTLILSIALVQAYRGKFAFIGTHWERCILAPIFGVTVWLLGTALLSLMAWLLSLSLSLFGV